MRLSHGGGQSKYHRVFLHVESPEYEYLQILGDRAAFGGRVRRRRRPRYGSRSTRRGSPEASRCAAHSPRINAIRKIKEDRDHQTTPHRPDHVEGVISPGFGGFSRDASP